MTSVLPVWTLDIASTANSNILRPWRRVGRKLKSIPAKVRHDPEVYVLSYSAWFAWLACKTMQPGGEFLQGDIASTECGV